MDPGWANHSQPRVHGRFPWQTDRLPPRSQVCQRNAGWVQTTAEHSPMRRPFLLSCADASFLRSSFLRRCDFRTCVQPLSQPRHHTEQRPFRPSSRTAIRQIVCGYGVTDAKRRTRCANRTDWLEQSQQTSERSTSGPLRLSQRRSRRRGGVVFAGRG